METKSNNAAKGKDFLRQSVDTCLRVITRPREFFRAMPKTGGFQEPILFAAAMGLLGGLVGLVLGIFGLGPYSGIVTLFFMGIIGMPIIVVIASFISAAVLFFIWKLMGSAESFETAYRCAAYFTGITPVTTILGVIPYFGVLSIVWMLFLVVVASGEVHGIEERRAWIVFGIIAALFVIMNVTAQRQAARFSAEMKGFEAQIEKMDEMTPEELGEHVGKFMKGFQQGAGQEPGQESGQ